MSDPTKKEYGNDAHIEKAAASVDDVHNLDEKALAAQYKAAAVEAETAEHNMGVLQAVRAYPMAAFWAFVMSCTIVRSLFFIAVLILNGEMLLTPRLDHGGLLCLHHG
jgi:SP family general alpha glucoside:H+ symporter-like MFS transporter